MWAVASGSVCERVARVKSSKRRRSTTVRQTRSAARIRRARRSTSASRKPSSSACGARAARPSARWEPIERRRAPGCGRGAGRGCGRARAAGGRRRGRASRRASSSVSAASWPTVAMPAVVQLRAPSPRRRPTAARPAAGAGTPARRPGATTSRPSGLATRAGDLGQELRARDADRDRQPDLVADPLAQPRRDLARACRRSARIPRTSMNASSIDSPSTSGDVSSKISKTPLARLRVGAHPRAARRSRAGTAGAPGARPSPSAPRTPAPRRTPRARHRHRRSPACPRSFGSSRCSTDAKNASRSAWRMVAAADTNICSHRGQPHRTRGHVPADVT